MTVVGHLLILDSEVQIIWKSHRFFSPLLKNIKHVVHVLFFSLPGNLQHHFNVMFHFGKTKCSDLQLCYLFCFLLNTSVFFWYYRMFLNCITQCLCQAASVEGHSKHSTHHSDKIRSNQGKMAMTL